MTNGRAFAIVLAAVSTAALALPGAGRAADFSGKTIEWIIPFKEGGGSDTWARFYAPLLSQALPGKPTVVVRNVPGGGSTKGANLFQSRAKPDGLTILGTSGSTQFPYLLDDKKVKYEYKDWRVVLASPTGGVFYVNPSLGVKSAKDLMKLKGKPLVYGSQGATSLDLVPLLALDLLGLDVKAVHGMKGRGEGRLAFERGETNVDYQTSSAYLKAVVPLVKAGKAVPIMSWGALDDNGKIVRDPTFPDLPSFREAFEMATGKAPSGDGYNAWKAFFASGFAAQKMVYLPKGTSDDILKTYQDAFRATFKDKAFKAKADKLLGKYEQAVGKGAEALNREAITVDPKAKAWVQNWLTTKHNVKF